MTYSALAADAGGAGGGRPGAWGGCTSFTVSTLASPFGWEVGSVGGSSLAGVYGLARLVRFCLRGVLGLVARLGGSLGLRASSPLPPLARSPFPQRGRLISGSCFAVSNLASPFGWEVGPLGLGGGELACGGVWPCAFSAVLFAWCVGIGALVVGQSKIESEFPPSVRLTPATFPQGGRLLGCAF